MSVEAKRGCGYRRIGGLYLVCEGSGHPCDKLPFRLHRCPTCSAGVKQARGWTWLQPDVIFGGDHANCNDGFALPNGATMRCPVCQPSSDKAGLLWVGAQFYKTTHEFLAEAATLGISKRIKALPHGFVLGQTWVLLAHPRAVRVVSAEHNALLGLIPREERNEAGVFRVFKTTTRRENYQRDAIKGCPVA